LCVDCDSGDYEDIESYIEDWVIEFTFDMAFEYSVKLWSLTRRWEKKKRKIEEYISSCFDGVDFGSIEVSWGFEESWPHDIYDTKTEEYIRLRY
jgi:hypothetical protein